MLGRLPWFALERRMRAFFFFVFFDMGSQASGAPVWFLAGQLPGLRRSQWDVRSPISVRVISSWNSFLVLRKRKTWMTSGTMKM